MVTYRDIPTLDEWLEITKPLSDDLKQKRALDELSELIGVYHAIPKSNPSYLQFRISMLNLISSGLNIFINILNPDLSMQKSETHAWLDYISQQSLKKSKYLEKIAALEKKYPDKVSLLNKLNQTPTQSEQKFLKIYGLTLLEKIDPAHRDFEATPNELVLKINHSNSRANKLFYQYLSSSTERSFFMWLEKKPATRLTPNLSNKWNKFQHQLNVVRYHLPDAWEVNIANGLLVVNAANKSIAATPLSTAKMKNQSFKIGAPLGATAFVWSAENENVFLTHPHAAGKHHHSSLVHGKKVRSAGMWLVVNGKVTHINNSSGHYQTTTLAFFKMIMHLYQNNVVTNETLVADMRRPAETVNGNIFGAEKSRYYKLPEYFEWACKQPEVRAYLQSMQKGKCIPAIVGNALSEEPRTTFVC